MKSIFTKLVSRVLAKGKKKNREDVIDFRQLVWKDIFSNVFPFMKDCEKYWLMLTSKALYDIVKERGIFTTKVVYDVKERSTFKKFDKFYFSSIHFYGANFEKKPECLLRQVYLEEISITSTGHFDLRLFCAKNEHGRYIFPNLESILFDEDSSLDLPRPSTRKSDGLGLCERLFSDTSEFLRNYPRPISFGYSLRQCITEWRRNFGDGRKTKNRITTFSKEYSVVYKKSGFDTFVKRFLWQLGQLHRFSEFCFHFQMANTHISFEQFQSLRAESVSIHYFEHKPLSRRFSALVAGPYLNRIKTIRSKSPTDILPLLENIRQNPHIRKLAIEQWFTFPIHEESVEVLSKPGSLVNLSEIQMVFYMLGRKGQMYKNTNPTIFFVELVQELPQLKCIKVVFEWPNGARNAYLRFSSVTKTSEFITELYTSLVKAGCAGLMHKFEISVPDTEYLPSYRESLEHLFRDSGLRFFKIPNVTKTDYLL